MMSPKQSSRHLNGYWGGPLKGSRHGCCTMHGFGCVNSNAIISCNVWKDIQNYETVSANCITDIWIGLGVTSEGSSVTWVQPSAYKKIIKWFYFQWCLFYWPVSSFTSASDASNHPAVYSPSSLLKRCKLILGTLLNVIELRSIVSYYNCSLNYNLDHHFCMEVGNCPGNIRINPWFWITSKLVFANQWWEIPLGLIKTNVLSHLSLWGCYCAKCLLCFKRDITLWPEISKGPVTTSLISQESWSLVYKEVFTMAVRSPAA